MRNRSIDNPVPRNLGHGDARRMTVDVILDRLHAPQVDHDRRRLSEMLGRKQRLQDQPWRRPWRPGAEGASTMELIRRFEARQKAH